MIERLHFSTRVLGPVAAFRLEQRQITQTLRSESNSIANDILLGRVSAGDRLDVLLDSALIGCVELISMDVVTWEALDADDARRGGFGDLFTLGKALQRASFRFMPLAKYEFYRIQFSWLEKAYA